MKAFKGLLKKDLKLSKTMFYTFLIMMAIMIATGFGFSGYYQKFDIVAVFAFGLVGAHVIYLPLSIYSSLRVEGKTQLWLHNPNSSILLLLSKILSSFIFAVISLTISILFATICLRMSDQMNLIFTRTELLFMGIFILSISDFMSIWGIFYWVIYHSLAKITWLKKIRWLLLFLMWNAWEAVTNFLDKLSFIKELKQIGVIKIGNALQFQGSEGSFSTSIESTEVSLVVIAGYLCITIILFFISSWLLDRKVEV
ncbi:hypothetical protein [Niallia sp. 01092]|uniref:hypothetical protein n=1 Tax=unclassified Niallia TaxID=2837522 RepID=UPI003FD0AA12